MEQALLLFGKVPRPGTVKTRLTPVLSPAEAARLYTAFLQDILRQVVRLDVDVRLYLAPPLPDGGLTGLPPDVTIHEQQGVDLAARLKNAFHHAFNAGYKRAVVLGTDHPTLPLSFVRQAFRSLEDSGGVCIGPTDDGGFYLLGMNALYPQLFEEMSYSHSRVFADTLARAAGTNAYVSVLPKWYDVDTPQDLSRLSADLVEGDVNAPNTDRLMDRFGLQQES